MMADLSLEELNWDVLYALGWRITEEVSEYSGKRCYRLRDSQHKIQATDAGDPYRMARRNGNVPLYVFDDNLALTLFEDLEYAITHRFEMNDEGERVPYFFITVSTFHNVNFSLKGYGSLAETLCKLFIMYMANRNLNPRLVIP
jgi:hypothetical protein